MSRRHTAPRKVAPAPPVMDGQLDLLEMLADVEDQVDQPEPAPVAAPAPHLNHRPQEGTR